MLTQQAAGTDECRVPLGWDKQLLDIGIRSKIYWYPTRASPHILIAGSSGSGKTKFSQLLTSCCVRDLNCILYLADPKRLDFVFANGCQNFWFGENSGEALEAFHASMMAAINETDIDTRNSERWKVLFFDELAAFTLLQTDKKRITAIQNILASILLLGRGVRHILVVAVQKALMEFFGSGGRSQFGTCVLLGNTNNDKEQVQMLMAQHKDTINATHNSRGQFWVTMDGEGIRRGQVPWIENTNDIHGLIIQGLRQ